MKLLKNKLISIKIYILFIKSFFPKNNGISRKKVLQYLKDRNLPKLNDDQCALCEKDITEEEVKHELNKM